MSVCVVIGAGTNGLVAAHYLARAGHRVVVLDDQAAAPPSPAGWLPPRIVRDLGLENHGWAAERPDPWLTVPLDGGEKLELARDVGRSAEAIRRLSPRDGERWPAFCERMARFAGLLARVYDAPPPDPLGSGWEGIAPLAALGLRARRLGREALYDLLRMVSMPVADVLDDWFECEPLKAALGAAAIAHVQHGPRSGGTAFNLLHHLVGEAPGVFRPQRSKALEALRALDGVELRARSRVAFILVRGGRAAGVVLASGAELAADLVVSEASAQRTLLELTDPGWFDPQLVHAVRHLRSRGVSLSFIATLDTNPGFTRLALATSLDALERAYDDAKYGRVSQTPYVEAVCVESADRRHRIEVHVQYAPYALREGTWDAERADRVARRGLALLAERVPHLGSAVIERITTPLDMERLYGWPQGQVQHAELALDQLLWARPLPELAHYRTPLHGLYLCGADMHPGGGIAGAAGAHAAAEALRDLQSGKGS
jgi:phytoene dehydrogenase-like protein